MKRSFVFNRLALKHVWERVQVLRRFVAAPMLLLMAVFAQQVQAQRIGDWEIERSRDLIMASTRNNGDSVFGYACNRAGNDCQFFYMPDNLRCPEGGRTTVLINGGQESAARMATCRRLSWSDQHQFANVLEGSDSLRRQILNAQDNGSVGIARAVGLDGFAFSTFSLRGFRGAFERINRFRDDPNPYGDNNRDYNRDYSRGNGSGSPAGGYPGGYPVGGAVGGVVGGGPVAGTPADAASDIEFFEHDGFRGRRLGLRNDLAQFDSQNFNDLASSIVVNRGQWEVCADERYAGRCKIFGPGRYPDLGDFGDQISSARRVR